jgi:RNA polymerase sigma-70 factor (ECF subfamily)
MGTGGAPDHAASVERVFRALGPAVHAYLRANCRTDSEDVLSEVFLRVARGLDKFSGDDDALRRWVFSIAHNCLIDELRRRSRRRAPAGAMVITTAPPDPIDPSLLDALRRLTPDQREVVTLRFIADLSLEEVARITSREIGAVKSLQHRALNNLAGVLRPLPAE